MHDDVEEEERQLGYNFLRDILKLKIDKSQEGRAIVPLL